MTQLDQISPSMYRRLFALLPPERQEKASRLRTDNRKLQSTLAYIVLVHALKQQTKLSQLPRLSEPGKPSLLNYSNMQCSISHCEKGVAAVVCEQPVGVDIESVRPYNPKVARYICSEDEYNTIEAAKDPALEFTILWTKKESCIKLYGGNIGPNMKNLSSYFGTLEFETKIGDGWVVTACCEKI